MEKSIYDNLKYNNGLGNCFFTEAKEGAVPRGISILMKIKTVPSNSNMDSSQSNYQVQLLL